MIDQLLGGKTSEHVLLYLAAMGKGYAAEIARAFHISTTQTQRTLDRLEQADILVAQTMGRARVYCLNERWILAAPLRALLDNALLYIPIDEQALYFGERKKPRKKGKRV